MLVKVAPLGERVVEVNVASGTSLGEVLRIADVSPNGRTIRLNGGSADTGSVLTEEENVVTLATAMKGGHVA